MSETNWTFRAEFFSFLLNIHNFLLEYYVAKIHMLDHDCFGFLIYSRFVTARLIGKTVACKPWDLCV